MLSIFLLAIALVLVFVPNVLPKEANATFGFCRGLGPGLNQSSTIPTSSVIDPSATNRKWTIQELFSNATNFSVYDGETSGTTGAKWLLYDTTQAKRGKGYAGWNNKSVKTKIQSIRNADRCAFGGMITLTSNIWLQLSSAIVSGGTAIVAQLFNPTFICTDPKNPNDCAINLIATIGGTNNKSGSGLIGNLTTGIYEPLIVFAFLFTACWLMYKGLIKRELRASFSGIAWSLAVFLFGIMALSKPTMLASAPQSINSTIGSCIIGAMDGTSCLSNKQATPSSLVGPECQSKASTSGIKGAELAVNGMGCTLWKSFVLNSWARSQFGRPYNDLYVSNIPKGGHKWGVDLGNNAKNYCIHLTSSQSAKSFNNGQVTTNGGPVVCNIALYQLYLNSGLVDKSNTGKNINPSDDYDSRYYNIILPVTKDKTSWNAWAPYSLQGGATRAVSSFSALLVTIIAMSSLVIFAFWGLVYSFAGTLLMAFAPLFLLCAVVPGKGKRIFLGWLDSVISSTLKYMASALFVIIALAMYSGILNNTSNSASAFIGILIMVGVMFTYRKEIINLLGAANLGGQKIQNKLGEKIHDKADKAKELSAIATGSGVGSVVAGEKFMPGFGEGFSRRLRRDNTFVGGVARQSYMTRKRRGDNTESPLAGKTTDDLKPNKDNPENQNPQNNGQNPDGPNIHPNTNNNDNDNPEDNNIQRCSICNSVLNADGTCPNQKNHYKFMGEDNPADPDTPDSSTPNDSDSPDSSSKSDDKAPDEGSNSVDSVDTNSADKDDKPENNDDEPDPTTSAKEATDRINRDTPDSEPDTPNAGQSDMPASNSNLSSDKPNNSAGMDNLNPAPNNSRSSNDTSSEPDSQVNEDNNSDEPESAKQALSRAEKIKQTDGDLGALNPKHNTKLPPLEEVNQDYSNDEPTNTDVDKSKSDLDKAKKITKNVEDTEDKINPNNPIGPLGKLHLKNKK